MLIELLIKEGTHVEMPCIEQTQLKLICETHMYSTQSSQNKANKTLWQAGEGIDLI